MKRRRRLRTLEGEQRTRVMPDITPIVNVALVLLIVFMVVTPMIREGIQVQTPQAENIEQTEAEKSVVLSVQEGGELFVNLKPVRRQRLEEELGLAYRGKEGKPIVIKGAKELPYKEIIALMDICKGIGAPGVELVARKGD